ncbi:hypothetical protein EK904_013815 [Melospiza melodia maxima]|nr:hypothetical protein EK904_013815 [Melospiza melodia maxima]
MVVGLQWILHHMSVPPGYVTQSCVGRFITSFVIISAEIKGGRENQISYLKISKLALAFAIIHSKPPGKSSKEYTEYLARTVSEQDFGWKWKVEVLEAEVLRLRQELLLNRISPRFCLENKVLAAEHFRDDILKLAWKPPVKLAAFRALHSVSQTLGLLGRNNILRNSLIPLLLSGVRQFAEQLLQAHQKHDKIINFHTVKFAHIVDQKSTNSNYMPKTNKAVIVVVFLYITMVQSVYDIAQYENIFLLCMILEQLLQNETEESNISSSDYGGEEKIKFLKNLDQWKKWLNSSNQSLIALYPVWLNEDLESVSIILPALAYKLSISLSLTAWIFLFFLCSPCALMGIPEPQSLLCLLPSPILDLRRAEEREMERKAQVLSSKGRLKMEEAKPEA